MAQKTCHRVLKWCHACPRGLYFKLSASLTSTSSAWMWEGLNVGSPIPSTCQPCIGCATVVEQDPKRNEAVRDLLLAKV